MRNSGLTVDDKAVNKALRSIRHKATHLTAFHKIVGNIMVESIKTNFRVGGRYKEAGSTEGGTKKWRALSATTLLRSLGKKSRKKRGGLTKRARAKAARRMPLIDTGSMRNSITFKANTTGVMVGTNKVQGAVHNFGHTFKVRTSGKFSAGRSTSGGSLMRVSAPASRSIPARPFLVIQEDDKKEIIHAAALYLKEDIR